MRPLNYEPRRLFLILLLSHAYRSIKSLGNMIGVQIDLGQDGGTVRRLLETSQQYIPVLFNNELGLFIKIHLAVIIVYCSYCIIYRYVCINSYVYSKLHGSQKNRSYNKPNINY